LDFVFGSAGFSLSSFDFCHAAKIKTRHAEQAAEKVIYFVIPIEMRGLSVV